MPRGIPDASNLLWVEGQAITLDFDRTSDTEGTLSWNIPVNAKVYDGIIITAALKEINPSNYPTDSTRYTQPAFTYGADPTLPIVDYTATTSSIGNAKVVVALYRDAETNKVKITGLDPSAVYFFSAHVVSNVNTYFTIGVRSYPASLNSEVYAGDIQKSYGPPANPVHGQVYYDENQKLVFAYDSVADSWTPTSSHSVLSGPIDPGMPGNPLTGSHSSFLVNGAGQVGSSVNIDGGVSTGFKVGDKIGFVGVNLVEGGKDLGVMRPFWVTADFPAGAPGTLQINPPLDVAPADDASIVRFITYPKLGDFFYNTTKKILRSWNGVEIDPDTGKATAGWTDAESLAGAPTYSKVGAGTDLTYQARANIIDILKKQLGYPAICIELTEDQFNIALDNALQEIRRRTDSAYTKQYFFMEIQPLQDVYYLNSPDKETDKIVDVLKIHRLNMTGLSNFGPDNIYAQQFLSQLYQPGTGFDTVSIHLVHSLSELYSQLFVSEVAFNWREAARELRLYRRIAHKEKVLLETSCEKMEQELLTDRWTQQWIQQWAEAELMFMLAHIRGKFATLPGPGGSLSLNASEMMAEGSRLQEDCLRQIKDYEVGQNGPDNWFSPFIIG